MVRVIIKGGVWKNTEDEILKAAIMKYGKNQWSRIASLLHRKSAKQCKARWYEWLDPRIKKTEWSREEDEKLLHLAKIMPTQWRTIAPIVGRTAAQCLERYENLLDEAQKRAEGIDDNTMLKEAKKLKPGDVDPTPETKPARPDPIDMDEDELEMLSEARARLANTQGKKAKRKAREKQLSEARRLASLQKRRELRAAGIGTGNTNWRLKKQGLIDYNEEVPFEKKTPIGFYDPSEDKFDKTKMVKLDDRPHLVKEIEERKKDKEKLKRKKAEDNPESIFIEKNEKKRSKLLLPEPQISDKELEEIVKIGHVSETVRELVDDSATSTLLHDYNASTRTAASLRTARTPAALFDNVARAADDLLALTNVETPLKGGINTPLHTLDFSASGTTRHNIATPNTVLSAVGGATPRTFVDGQTPASQFSATPGSTPFRDQLNINNETGADTYLLKDQLRKQFNLLPKPKNDFELMAPDEDEEINQKTEDWIEDEEELKKFRENELEKRRIDALKLRTKVIQRNLPLPIKLNELYKTLSNSENNKADDLIKSEIYALMEWDVNGKQPTHLLTIDELNAAQKLIDNEIENREILDANMWQIIKNCSSELIRHRNRFVRLSNLNRNDQIEALSDNFKLHYKWWNQQKTRCDNLKDKLVIKLGGYKIVKEKFENKINELRNEKDRLLIELKTFKRLEQNEEQAIIKRIETLKEEVNIQLEREKVLQKRYDQLQNHRYELEQIKIREQATISVAPTTNLSN